MGQAVRALFEDKLKPNKQAMKTTITTLGMLALASSISFAEGDRKPQRKPHNPAKIIEHLDKDGSGTVSKDEFLGSERAQNNPDRAAKAFDHIDADGNGELTTQEFAEHRPREGRDGDRRNPAEVFKHLDKDGNGSISKDEFTSGERAQRNPEMAARLFGRLDADSNGEISREEFAKRPRRGGDDRRPGVRPEGGERPDTANIE